MGIKITYTLTNYSLCVDFYVDRIYYWEPRYLRKRRIVSAIFALAIDNLLRQMLCVQWVLLAVHWSQTVCARSTRHCIPNVSPLKGNVQIALVALPLLLLMLQNFASTQFCTRMLVHHWCLSVCRSEPKAKRPNAPKHHATANASVNCLAYSIAINANFGARSTSEIRSSFKGWAC